MYQISPSSSNHGRNPDIFSGFVCQIASVFMCTVGIHAIVWIILRPGLGYGQLDAAEFLIKLKQTTGTDVTGKNIPIHGPPLRRFLCRNGF